jgi:ketosteroid isomerase-like protein
MNRVIFQILAVALLIMSGGCGHKKISNMSKENLETTIITMEKAALEKWLKGNPDGYLSIYAESFTYFDPIQRINGFEKIKEFYESLRGSVQVEKYEMIDPIIQISGETAVLTYGLVTYSGGNVIGENCTEVYQQQPDKQWKIIHSHWSLSGVK